MKGICKANGIDISYIRANNKKPSLILLHGLMLNGACWMPLARIFEKDYDVIVPDARGHGSSSAPKNGYSYEYLATDLKGFIEELNIESPVVLGHSM